MRKWLQRLLPATLLLLLAVFAWTVFHQSEPVYQGKHLGEYLDELANQKAPELDDQTANAVYHCGPRAIPYLRQAFRQKNSVKKKLLVFLHAKLPKRLERHLPAVPDPFYYQRLSMAAAQCLSLFGPAARPAVPELLDCFNEPGKANLAYYAVEQIGPKPEDLPRLLVFLKGTNFDAPMYAAELIGEIGMTNAKVLAALIDRAQAGDPNVRAEAIAALGHLSDKANPAVPMLTTNLDDPNATIRIVSALALWQIRGKQDPPVVFLMNELDEENKPGSSTLTARLRWDRMDFHENELMYISIVAKDIGAEAKPLAPLLREAETNLPDWKCFYLADALWSVARDTNKLADICQDVLAIPDFGQQARAADLLARVCIEEHQAWSELNEMMSNPNTFIRVQGARALWEISGETNKVLNILISGLLDHGYYLSTDARIQSAITLGDMGPKAVSAVPALKMALKDCFPSVQIAASNALRNISSEASSQVNRK